MDRRKFIRDSGMMAISLPTFSIKRNHSIMDTKITTIIFDAFPIFNPKHVFDLTLKFFPDKGADLNKEWKAKQFEYTWLRSMSKTYLDFLTITDNSLIYAAQLLKINVSESQRKELVDAYLKLQTWPEVIEILTALKSNGYRLGILSNFTSEMLRINAKNCQLENLFEHLLSVEQVKAYKPDPISYQIGIDTFKVNKSEVLFVPFAGWDASGAKSFGYETFWVNRLNMPLEQLGNKPDGIGLNLKDLKIFCDRK